MLELQIRTNMDIDSGIMPKRFDYFSADALRKDLKRKTVRGGLFTAAAQGAITLINFASVPILARLLTPADFGLVAMVSVFTGLAAMFVDAGLSMATIQRDRINHQQVSNLFWIATASGVAIAAVFAVLSPLIAWFYREPRLVPIAIALSFSLVFSGLTIQHQALLRRAMRLKALAIIQVASVLFAYTITIAIASWYHSYWALVVMPLTAALVRMLLSWFICQWLPALPRRDAGMRSMVGFGANLTGFSFVNYFARNADNMLVGWWWGEVPLGFYERGYKLMMAPLTQINAPLAQLMVPALSRLSNEPEKYRKAYFQAVGLLQAVACPLMAFVAVTAPRIVDVVFGPGWEEVGPILRWLAIAGFIQPVCNSLGWLYISQDRTKDLMHWGFVGCSLIVLSFVAGLAWGPIAVARSYAVTTYALIVPLGYWYAGHRGPVTSMDLARLTGTTLLLAIPVVTVATLLTANLSEYTSLVVVAVSGFGSLAAMVATFASTRSGRAYLAEIAKLIVQSVGGTPKHSISAGIMPPRSET